MNDPLHRALLSHLQAFLRHQPGTRTGDQADGAQQEFFLLHDEQDTFWELVGFKPQGYPAVLLGGFRFRRQESSAKSYARRPLSFYLSQPPKEIGVRASARPAGLIEVMLPEVGESVSAFRRRVQAGERVQAFFLDADLLELAFDFRVENPSVERERALPSTKPEPHLFRTIHGHILSGISHGLHARLHQEAHFLTLHRGVQHTPTQRIVLPTLAVHRSIISMDAPLNDLKEVDDWLGRSVAFHRNSAEPRYMLLPSDRTAPDPNQLPPDARRDAMAKALVVRHRDTYAEVGLR